jgi:drug/metabolite transporter (DMT)-like permease
MKIIAAMAVIVALTVGANVLLKVGAGVAPSERIFFGMLGWLSVGGLCLYACAGLLYAWVLRWIPLHMAQILIAAQFVGIMLASWLILSEQIGTMQWTAIGLITAGLLVAGASYRLS